MGIPHLFGFIKRKFPSSIKEFTIIHPYPCDYLYIDFNAIVHECVNVQSTTIIGSVSDYEDKLISTAVSNLISLIKDVTCPSKGVYVALDGRAPMAKMHQQRIRRYMSRAEPDVSETTANSVIFCNYNSTTSWDRNAISPGTPFMYKLSTALHAFATSFNLSLKHEYIIISCPYTQNGEGEGEQKIFKHIREMGNGGHKSYKIIVHGLDADLILMSLMSPMHMHIELLRASSSQTNNTSNINIIKIGILYTQIMHAIDINDFVLLCILMGNDFIPHAFGLQFHDGGFDTLISVYTKIMHGRQTCISRGGPEHMYGVRIDILKEIFLELSRDEANVMQNQLRIYIAKCGRASHNQTRRFGSSQTSSSQTNEIEWCPLLYPDMTTTRFLQTQSTSWRTRYYHSLFNGMHTSTQIQDICALYLAGIVWTYAYIGSQVEMHEGWYYHLPKAPTMLDMYHLLCEDTSVVIQKVDTIFDNLCIPFRSFGENITKIVEKRILHKEHSIRVILQCYMMLIMPPHSIKTFVQDDSIILSVIEGIHGEAQFMFPNKFVLQTLGHDKKWQCTPLLPYIDFGILTDALTKAWIENENIVS